MLIPFFSKAQQSIELTEAKEEFLPQGPRQTRSGAESSISSEKAIPSSKESTLKSRRAGIPKDSNFVCMALEAQIWRHDKMPGRALAEGSSCGQKI